MARPLRIEYPGAMYHVMNLGESTPECVKQKSGHLFQGRYKAQLVESEEYISKLSRYIHLNPVRVKKYAKLSVKEKRNILLNYTWSSFRAHIGKLFSVSIGGLTRTRDRVREKIEEKESEISKKYRRDNKVNSGVLTPNFSVHCDTAKIDYSRAMI